MKSITNYFSFFSRFKKNNKADDSESESDSDMNKFKEAAVDSNTFNLY